MKKTLFFSLALLLSEVSFAQVGIGTTTPYASRSLETPPNNKNILSITTDFSGGLGDKTPFNTKVLATNQAGIWTIVSGGGTLSGTTYTAPVLTNTEKYTPVTLQFTSTSPQTPSSKRVTFMVSSCFIKTAANTYTAFMCYNLGATTTLDPHTPVEGVHGNYYQWGSFSVVANASTAAEAISGWNITTAPNGSWLDTSKTTNDPCPKGFRVPTMAQWTGAIANNTLSRSGSWTNSNSNYASALHFGMAISPNRLTLPAAGYRNATDGTLDNRGFNGNYWSSTEYGSLAYNLAFSNSGSIPFRNDTRYGFSVRCVAE